MKEKRFAICTNCGYKVTTRIVKGQIISCSSCKGKFVEPRKEVIK